MEGLGAYGSASEDEDVNHEEPQLGERRAFATRVFSLCAFFAGRDRSGQTFAAGLRLQGFGSYIGDVGVEDIGPSAPDADMEDGPGFQAGGPEGSQLRQQSGKS